MATLAPSPGQIPADVWSPIVYGRTVRADNWWRAVPDGLSPHDWLGTLVSAIVDGGNRLDRPRWLLARLNGYWVTGVACMAAEFSENFASDGQRSLYTFVGWAAQATADRLPPALADLQREYRAWAGPPYREWVGRDWEEPTRRVRDPHPTSPVRDPWPPPRPVPVGEPLILAPAPGQVELWPAADEARLWQAGLASRQAFVLVVGWEDPNTVPRSTLTHAAVDGLSAPERVPAKPGGLELAAAADDAGAPDPDQDQLAQRAGPSRAWPQLKLADSGPPPAARSGGWPFGSRDPDGQSTLGVQLLIVSSTDEVLMIKEEGERLRMPAGLTSRREQPSAACVRVARDSLGLTLSNSTPIIVTHWRDEGLWVMFHCWLDSDQAEVGTAGRARVALRPLADMPGHVRAAVDQLRSGAAGVTYIERAQPRPG